MRRGSLRLRSTSALRRGRIPVDYLREVVCVSVIIGSVLALQQSFRTSPAAVEHPHVGHPVYALSLTQDGEKLWISREAYGISEIDLVEGTECEHVRLHHAEASYAAHGGGPQALTLRFGFDQSLELMHGHETLYMDTIPPSYLSVTDTAVSADGGTAVLISTNGLLLAWKRQAEERFERREYVVPQGCDHVLLTQNGRHAALLNSEEAIWIDLESGQETKRWKTTLGGKYPQMLNRPEAKTLSPDDRFLALGFNNGLVRIWDCESQQLVWERQTDEYKASALAFSRTGLLATGGFSKKVRLWDWRNDTLKWERTYHARAIHDVVMNRDETRLYCGGLDGKVVEVCAVTGDLIRQLP